MGDTKAIIAVINRLIGFTSAIDVEGEEVGLVIFI